MRERIDRTTSNTWRFDRLTSNINENNEKIINNEHEISKLIKALPKDIAALDKRSVLANVNSQGSGT